MDLQAFREVIAPFIAIVGGLVGLIGGGLSIYYNSTYLSREEPAHVLNRFLARGD
jgi:hypothetical protein